MVTNMSTKSAVITLSSTNEEEMFMIKECTDYNKIVPYFSEEEICGMDKIIIMYENGDISVEEDAVEHIIRYNEGIDELPSETYTIRVLAWYNGMYDTASFIRELAKPDKVVLFDRKDMFGKLWYIKYYLYQIGFIEQGGNNCGDYRAIYEDMSLNVYTNLAKEAVDYVYYTTIERLKAAISKAQADISAAGENEYNEQFVNEINEWEINCADWDYFGPHRKYPNEVDLPPICEKLLSMILSEFHEQHESDEYVINCYDFSGYEITFATFNEAEYFADHYIDTGTLYRHKDGEWEEIYSF